MAFDKVLFCATTDTRVWKEFAARLCAGLLFLAAIGGEVRAETVGELVKQYQTFNSRRQAPQRYATQKKILAKTKSDDPAVRQAAHRALREVVTPWLIREYDWVNHPSQSAERIAVMKKMQELGWDASGATTKARASLRSESDAEKKVAKETVRIINTTKAAGVVASIDYLRHRFALRTNQGVANLRFDEKTVGWKELKQGRPMVVTFEVGSGYASKVEEGLGAGVLLPPGPGGNVPPAGVPGPLRPPGPLRAPPSLNCQLEFRYANPNDKRTGIGIITNVARGGLADVKGLRAGDRILRVNGSEIHSIEDYRTAALAGGGRLDLLVQSRVDGRTRVVVCGAQAPQPRR